MILSLIIVIVGSALIGLAVKVLFPKRGNWLPIVLGGLVPPFLIFPIGMYYVLVDIGLHAERTGETGVNIDKNAPIVGELIGVSGLWIIIGIPAVALALHLFDRYRARQ